jgi:hypothetical protein
MITLRIADWQRKHPMSWQTFCDKTATFWSGCVRIRVISLEPDPVFIVYGKLHKDSEERLKQLIVELKPAGPGYVDFQPSNDGHWSVTVHGPLAEDYFAQRMRNSIHALPIRILRE